MKESEKERKNKKVKEHFYIPGHGGLTELPVELISSREDIQSFDSYAINGLHDGSASDSWDGNASDGGGDGGE